MELKEFINNTLTQIADGVKDAIDASRGKGYFVNPTSGGRLGADCVVHFDLSVENDKEGEAGIKVVSGSLSEKSVNRINFDITLTLPVSDFSSKPAYQSPR